MATKSERWKELPPITLNDVSASYLVTLIPVLVSMTSSGDEPCFDNETDKPAWWPQDVKWRNPKFYMQDKLQHERLVILRKLVHSCYSYHGVEDLLCRLDDVPPTDESGSDEKGNPSMHDALSDDPVFVCCFCLEQFSSHEEVSNHQNICRQGITSPTSHSSSEDVAEYHAVPRSTFRADVQTDSNEAAEFLDSILSSAAADSALGSNRSQHVGQLPLPKTVSSNEVPAKKAPTSRAPPSFVPVLKTRSQKKLDQIMLRHNMKKQMLKECEEMRANPRSSAWWVKRRRPKYVPTEPHPGTYTSQPTFCASLGLQRSQDVKKEAPDEEQEVDLDCEIVSVEGPLSATSSCTDPAQTMASPRSSRSLMSHISRDDNSTKRRLSFRFLADEWADKEAIEEGKDPLQASLLSIEFSSPLGVRIKKYMAGEGSLNIIKDPEDFCKTEDVDDSCGKLRARASDYRVTYRKKRKASNFVHKYKFNKSDRREFHRLMQTGLSPASRRLQRQLSKCHVKLKRMPEAEIKEWCEGKKISIKEQIIYDDDICITQIDIPESQMKKAIAQSQERKLKSGYRPMPKCHQVQGKRAHLTSSASQRPLSSSPHVPNIFRNRGSHTASPPRPSPHPTAHQLNSGRIALMYNDGTRLMNFPSHPGSDGLNTLKHSGRGPFPPYLPQSSHLSQHYSLNPSVHSRHLQQNPNIAGGSVHIRHNNAPVSGSSSPNRRKQQLNQVRHDGLDSVRVALVQGNVSNHLNGEHTINSVTSSGFQKLQNLHCQIKNGRLNGETVARKVPLQGQTVPPSVQRQQVQHQRAGHPSYRSRSFPDWGTHQHDAPLLQAANRRAKGSVVNGGSHGARHQGPHTSNHHHNSGPARQHPRDAFRNNPSANRNTVPLQNRSNAPHEQLSALQTNPQKNIPSTQDTGKHLVPPSSYASNSGQSKNRTVTAPLPRPSNDDEILEVICIDDD